MSEHWYAQDGSPCYRVEKQGGGLRATHLGDARKLKLVPSVTTVLGVIAKPALTNWMVDQGILAALTLPRRDDEAEDAWLRRVKDDSKQQAIQAAEEGTRIHNACEAWFTGEFSKEHHAYYEHVAGVREELKRLFPGVTDWRAEDSFSAHGYGGKVDLHSPSTGIVVDFKGKDGDFSDGKKLAYDQHWQLSAYQYGLRLPTVASANIFVSRTHPGKVASHVWTPEDMASGLRVFLAALELWVAMRGYDPRSA
jgi:hypothetical protein